MRDENYTYEDYTRDFELDYLGFDRTWPNSEEHVNIMQCQNEDIVRIGQFYDDVVLWLNDHINDPRWNYGVYPGAQSVRMMTEDGAQYYCTDGEKVLAAFGLNNKPQGNYQKVRWSQQLSDGSYMVLHALAVDPMIQTRRVASKIIRFCIDKAKSDGYKAIRVDIVPSNVPARKLFEKNGFSYVGDVDLELNIRDIPAFSLYELNF